MSTLERWKPVFVVFIFAFGFFEFSQLPFTDSETASLPAVQENLLKRTIVKRSLEKEDPISRVEEAAQSGGTPDVPRSKRRSKKNNPLDDGVRDSIDYPAARAQRRSNKKKSRSSNKPYSRYSKAFTSKRYKLQRLSPQFENYDDSDENPKPKPSRKKIGRGRKQKKIDSKRKASLIFTGPSNFTLLNPKTPLDLPIVKPETLDQNKTEDLIPTKNRPFHFHIRMVSKEPEVKASMDELMVIALKYKNPLTLEDKEVQSAPSSQSLTQKQRSSMKRMVRDSPVLDFLNIAALIVGKRSTSGPEDQTTNVDSVSDLSSHKKDVIQLNVTDELLQEVLGDEDDLLELQQRLKSRAAYSDEIVKKSEYIVGSDMFKSKNQDKIDKNAIRRKRYSTFYDFYDESSAENDNKVSPILTRKKRGLGSWLKKKFWKKETTTTTTTTEKPKKKNKKASSEEKDSSSEKNKKTETKKADYFVMKTDKNGDTEVDKLLPVYLRRSSYLKRKIGEYSTSIKSLDSFEEETNSKKGDNDEDSAKDPKTTKIRTKRNLFGNDLNFDGNDDSLNEIDSQPNPIFPKDYPGSQVLTRLGGFTKLSKDDLKLIHEMFSNIIDEKCGFVSPVLLEKLEGTISNAVDRSTSDHSDNNDSNPTLDRLLQQIINCSSNPEKTLQWQTERGIIQKMKRYEQLEQGRPLQRTKRILRTSEDIWLEFKSYGDNRPAWINQITQLVSKMGQIVHEACVDVIDSDLIQSASLLLEQAVQLNFSNLENFPDHHSILNSREASELEQYLKTCSKNPSHLVSSGNLYGSIEMQASGIKTLDTDSRKNFKPRVQLSYGVSSVEKLTPFIWSQMLPVPKPVPAPPVAVPFRPNEYGRIRENEFQNTVDNYSEDY